MTNEERAEIIIRAFLDDDSHFIILHEKGNFKTIQEEYDTLRQELMRFYFHVHISIGVEVEELYTVSMESGDEKFVAEGYCVHISFHKYLFNKLNRKSSTV